MSGGVHVNCNQENICKRARKNHGVVDTNNMSDDLKKALSNRGVTEAELKKVAGADGQIKGKDEFKKLFKAVDQFDKRTPKSFQADHLTNNGTCREQYSKTLSGEVYDKLKKEVTNNRLEARYKKPGTVAAEDQPKLTINNHALTVPDSERKKNVNLRMKGIGQFSLHPGDKDAGNKACFEAAEKQAKDFNREHHKNRTPKLNGPSTSNPDCISRRYAWPVKSGSNSSKNSKRIYRQMLG